MTTLDIIEIFWAEIYRQDHSARPEPEPEDQEELPF